MATPLVTIAVWEFTPSRRCTLFQDASVDSLLVRLHFLDIPFHETETPYAFPKPREAGDNVNFDFVKVFHLDDLGLTSPLAPLVTAMDPDDNRNMQQAVSGSQTRSNDGATSRRRCVCDSLGIELVNEPDDLATFEDCSVLGQATVSLREVWTSHTDLDRTLVPVYSTGKEEDQLLGHFSVSLKICAVLDTIANNCQLAQTQPEKSRL